METTSAASEGTAVRARRAGGGKRMVQISALALLGIAVLLAVGIMPRLQRRTELDAAVRATASSIPAVTIMTPTIGPRTTDLLLPGSIQAIQETSIYSRVDGYLKQRHVDIGDRVEAGQVLAEIDTPDLDQQLAQARATMASAEATLAQARSSLLQARAALQHNRATLEYSGTVLGRWRELRRKELVAQQDVDDKQVAYDASRADVEAAEANVEAIQSQVAAAQANTEANRANVQRLVELQSYQRVRAPFTGVVTVRNIDGGALIASGSTTTNTPMFKLAQTDSLRIFVNVPQTFTNAITPGMAVQLLIREFPKRPFSAKVASTSGALDPASRTLLTEVRMRNEGDLIRPGMYADVRFHLERDNPPLVIPTSALIIRTGGPQVGVVGADQKVRIQPVELGRDFGITVEVIHGLDARDNLIVTPPDGLQAGMAVRPVAAPKPKG